MSNSPDPIQKPLVFAGEFRPVLDEKKRLTIPSRWRSASLGELFIVKSPRRGCLAAMPQEVMHEMGAKAALQAATVADHQAFKDQFFASALICPIDSQGRIVLTEDLCRFAGIKKDAVLAGGETKFDIWNPEAWAQRQQVVAPTFETILTNIGL
jgi:MraZ protein